MKTNSAIDARSDWLAYPTVADGAEGVRFIHATVASNAYGAWTSINQKKFGPD